jgi:hypothetical protein
MIQMNRECSNCKYYKGDCGKHHTDYNGHIDYNIPSEYMYDHGWLTCFEPSEEYICEIHEEQAKELASYPIDVIKRALEFAKSKESDK